MAAERLSDKELMDWLSERQYVEATIDGHRDPERFEWVPVVADLRLALSTHIRRTKPSRRGTKP